ncbi:MAG: hypothetical protein K0S11_524 [Gammaproteobacteria bacterium]|jgi:hypothetical protein|nr:hypothetical protein [Gammaproteobacteria bacterium]
MQHTQLINERTYLLADNPTKKYDELSSSSQFDFLRLSPDIMGEVLSYLSLTEVRLLSNTGRLLYQQIRENLLPQRLALLANPLEKLMSLAPIDDELTQLAVKRRWYMLIGGDKALNAKIINQLIERMLDPAEVMELSNEIKGLNLIDDLDVLYKLQMVYVNRLNDWIDQCETKKKNRFISEPLRIMPGFILGTLFPVAAVYFLSAWLGYGHERDENSTEFQYSYLEHLKFIPTREAFISGKLDKIFFEIIALGLWAACTLVASVLGGAIGAMFFLKCLSSLINTISMCKPMELPTIPKKTDLLVKLEEKYPANQYRLFWHHDIEEQEKRVSKIRQESVFIQLNRV